jgi:hypothetical protein
LMTTNFEEGEIKFKFSVYLHWRKIDDCYDRPTDAVNNLKSDKKS